MTFRKLSIPTYIDCLKWTLIEIIYRRVDDGDRLCKDLILLVQERANIEKEFAKQLKQWSAKWNSLIEKGPEYGTTEAAWKAVLNEADRRCELHLRVKENLHNEVISSIKNWQKDNYHKQVCNIIYMIMSNKCPSQKSSSWQNFLYWVNFKDALMTTYLLYWF